MMKIKGTKKQTSGEKGAATQEKKYEAHAIDTPPSSAPEQMAQRAYEVEEAAAATVWRRNQRINGLWGKNETRNSWISITGHGWKKLASTTDSGIIALTFLASQALESGRPVDCREEADGMIHEIYLW
jgi:hypothetical protein